MSRLGHKSVVYHGELRLGELDVNQVSTGHGFRFSNDEIRIHHLSPGGERCPPLAILQTIASFAVRCKLESSAPVKPPELMHLHARCFHELKTAVVLLGDEEIHLVAMPSKEKKFPCFWCFAVPLGLYDSCLRMLNTRCLSIVFDLDETLIVANTMKSFEDRIEGLKTWMSREMDPMRINGMSAELTRYMDDRMLLKQYIDNDYAFDNGVLLKAQPEEVRPTSDGLEKVFRPVIRLPEKNTVLTRINPEIRDTSVLVKLRPAWEELRSYLTANNRKRFEVYVCTMAERDYALEMWRLLDPEAHLISLKELRDRIVCVKPDAKKSLLNVFNGGICHPKMALVIDDCIKVWEDKDQPRVHVVNAYLPYYAPQAETAQLVPHLCVARNVACNVRGYFFKEFDESLMSSISLVHYEDDVENLPPSPDVSNYVIIEDPGFASNGNINAPPIAEGMCGGEVERRLNQAAAADSSTLPATSNAEQKPETPKPQMATIPNNPSTTTAAALFPSHTMEDDFCWDVKSPELLNVVLNQKRRLICWAISFVRHLESVYRLEGKLVRLSVQELLNIIPRTLINRNKGDLIAPLDVFADYVKNNGTVAESDCPFTCVVHRLSRAPTENVPRYQPSKVESVSYNDHNMETFEHLLRQALQNSPVAASIIIANGYDSIEGDAIYKPNEADEDVADYGFGHMLLIIGCGIDEHGQRYWIAQDSFGSGQGQDGIIRIARFDDIVTDFFVISVDVDE